MIGIFSSVLYLVLAMPFVIFIVFAALVGVFAYLGYLAEKKRKEALRALASRLGMTYKPGKDRSLASQYSFIDRIRQGSNRYALNIMQGLYRDQQVILFDYHYETHSADSKGHRRTHHHYLSFFILTMERAFPELKISREGIFSKIGQFFGYDDIDFESHEFSKKFCVRSTDKKFAYDICHARMIEFMLSNDDLSIEIENRSLALAFGSKTDPARIQHHLDRLIAVRELMPNYLFED